MASWAKCFFIIIISNDCIQHSEKISIATPNLRNFFIQQHNFFAGF